MYQPFDDDDLDHLNLHSGTAGDPDPEDADSMSLWFSGLLEDPLYDPNSSEHEDYSDLDDSVLLPGSERSGQPTTAGMEGINER